PDHPTLCCTRSRREGPGVTQATRRARLARTNTSNTEAIQDPGAASRAAPQRLDRGVADAGPRRFPGAVHRSAPWGVLAMDFGCAALYTLVGVTTGAKLRHALLALAFRRRPPHSLSRG